MCVGTTHNEYLVVFSIVHNLVAINALVLINASFNILQDRSKNAYSHPFDP